MRIGTSPPTIALLLGIWACARPVPATPTSTSSAEVEPPRTAAREAPRCEVVCKGAEIATRSGESPEARTQAIAGANRVLATMNDDLLACYKARLAVAPLARADLQVDIVIEPDGRVRRVDAKGGEPLGPVTVACILSRIKRATFEPDPMGGTQHVIVPFTLSRVDPDETY